ncbi:putative disease resistance protein RGA1 [Sesamum alatum]|uniref:Disease resistance protein RGA1 n=1 Tax=Sesamum alatum TaxID=300844 RepID=A0AAE1YAB3_9LAMI|nr:putative disease resistance protein RGA1 [Sesamum alatum]
MADLLVSAVVETVLGILRSAGLQEVGAIWALKNELESLESIFCTIQLVLQDAEIKQRKSQALQNWLWKLKQATYDAENILDRLATEDFRRRAGSERGMQHKLSSFLSKRNPLLFRLKIVNEVRNIRGNLDAIAKERLDFHLGESVVENRFGESLESRLTSSLVNELEIYGRAEEKEMIMEKMLDSMREQDDLSVYAIWGMGGLGKTTLAQMIYSDERMEMHFELRIWVCVSDDFSIQRLAKAILESIDGEVCNISELDPLQRLLQERLRGKKFLLVLDDVWNENHELWDRMREVLRCGSKGSVLIITTRIEKVAFMMATIGVHQIGYLSEDDSWSLFRQRAFKTGDGKENFVAIGNAIVKKCGGVPLAIKALGSLMQFKSHESEWLAIKESEIWQLSDDENGILPALRLSYYNLGPQMRQCFGYCCIFPKDYVMKEKQLIQLWMANGFVDLYLTGRMIFKELVWRSFLQDVKRNYRGEVTCKMHDLMHDLAVFVMGCETYILEHDKVMNIPKTVRHLYFNLRYSSMIRDKKIKALKCSIGGSLRSLIVASVVDISSLITKQQYLRALDQQHYEAIEHLPNLVYKLEHLRYLVMSCKNFKRLPESLTHLHNLQTLKLMNSFRLLELPKGACHQIDQLKELNLGGSLSIKGLENVRNAEDAKRANLMTKNNLTSLSLLWTNNTEKNSMKHYEEVLHGLQPHHNLESICIKSYKGSKFPNWMSTVAFNNLMKVTLEDCRRCEHLPPLAKLPSLTYLKLDRMDSIKCLNAEFHGHGECLFPTLKTLIILDMPNLEGWKTTNSVESFSCLEDLEITRCPKLSHLPVLPSLRSLNICSSSETLLGSLPFLTSLKSLWLSDFSELAVFPEGLLQNNTALEELRINSLSSVTTLSDVLDNLSALKNLYLHHCSHLEFLPEGLKNLSSLERLELLDCDSLMSFPAAILEDLSSLKVLNFYGCKKLKPFLGPMKRATILQDLELIGLREMEHLPESMQLFTSLRRLTIVDCEGLCSLPDSLGCLESLSSLEIRVCKNLNSLPDGFRCLRRLVVRGCPQLKKRYNNPKGVDWQKISHVPNTSIG